MVARRPRTVTQAANRRDLSLKKAPPGSIGGRSGAGQGAHRTGPASSELPGHIRMLMASD